MAEDSKIEWTRHTFNHVRGCTKVSAGCQNCYAEAMSGRNHTVLGQWGPNGTRVVASEAMWKEPVQWDRKAKEKGERHRVFCASLADVFEDWPGPMVDSRGDKLIRVGPGSITDPRSGAAWKATGRFDEYDIRDLLTMQDVRGRLFRLIGATPSLDWLLLTKRPQNVLRMTHDAWCPPVPAHVSQNEGDGHHWKYPSNVWLGTSVENQAAADDRIPYLLKVPVRVRFLSCEPLLGPVDLSHWLGIYRPERAGANIPWSKGIATPVSRIHWVIVGGESGPGARPMQVEWARSLVEQCRVAGVKCFVKQLGSHPVQERSIVLNDGETVGDLIPLTGRLGKSLSDKKGGDVKEFPAALRVREFPEVIG